jgi:3-deoxy-D-manno-octulosonate 8-phosphate phosphatase (KDO 8-P phosphatase)
MMENQDFSFEYHLENATVLKNALARFRDIRTFIFDVDGVLTDGKMLVTEGGEFLRSYHSRDGYAIRRTMMEGFRVVIITGGSGPSVDIRMKKLGVTQYFMGIEDKLPVFQRFIEANDIDPAEILYMGDDLNDYQVMQKVGLAACPADACPEIQDICHYISPFTGGAGCVRDVIEKVMKLNGVWMRHLAISNEITK